MTAALATLLILLSLLGFASLTAARPAGASTCSLLEPREANLELESAAKQAELVFLGRVTSEVKYLDPVPSTMRADEAFYASHVEPLHVLKGDAPGELELRGMNRVDVGCQGGPRLHEGEMVLLFVRWSPNSIAHSVPSGHTW